MSKNRFKNFCREAIRNSHQGELKNQGTSTICEFGSTKMEYFEGDVYPDSIVVNTKIQSGEVQFGASVDEIAIYNNKILAGGEEHNSFIRLD